MSHHPIMFDSHDSTDAAAQDFLDDVFDRAVRLVEDGLIPEVDALVAGHEALRAEVERLVQLARQVAVGLSAPLPTIAGFTILHQLGQGGMGAVYLARQHSLGGRPVALKVLPAGAALSQRSRARFLAEALAIAKLRHPNIVAVHDVVHQDDVYAYAMEWIDGASLADVIACPSPDRKGGVSAPDRCHVELARHMPISDVARIGIAIARALDAVHDAGLLHRDVKPSNILLRRDGTPLLADFGLARELDSSVYTQAGHFAGTVAYSSPEQLRGQSEAIDARSDVYSLGVTLYHALAGQLPFEARNPTAMLRRIESGAAKPLRKVNPRVPRDLETIVAKAMEVDPARRYQTARELADDLERFMNYQPIRARPASLVTRTSKLVRRNRGAALGLTIGSVATLAVAAVLVTYVFFRPGWIAGHVREARLALLNPNQANTIASVLLWPTGGRGWMLNSQERRDAFDRALLEYDAAVRLSPYDASLQAERTVVRQVREALDRGIPPVEPAELSLRNQGLYAFLVHDARAAIKHWSVWEKKRDPLTEPDPLVDAALGVLYLFDDQAARAYPRLQKAVEAFPGVGFLMEYLADAAAKCGDAERARRWLEESKRLPRRDGLGAAERIHAATLAVEGHTAEAIAAYRAIPDFGPPQLELARLLAKHDHAAALPEYVRLVRKFPRSTRVAREFRAAAERWWNSLSSRQRRQLIRTPLYMADDPGSLVAILGTYALTLKSGDSLLPHPAKAIFHSNFLFEISNLKFAVFRALFNWFSSPSLESRSLSELAENLEVENMLCTPEIASDPGIPTKLQFASRRWPLLRSIAALADAVQRKMRWSRVSTVAVTAALMSASSSFGQVFTTEPYASVTDATLLSFSASGNLYCGRDASGSGGGSGDPARIHRVGPGGSPVVELGASPIDDPDSILFDALGVLSVPGSVLVGGLMFNSSTGHLSAIRPDNSVAILYSSNVWQNVNEMKFDHSGRLLFTSISYTGEPHGVFVSTGGPPTRLATVSGPPVHIAIAPNDEFFVSCTDGAIRRFAADGTLINNNFASGYGSIEFGPGGVFGTDLYLYTFATGVLSRLDISGVATPVLTGLPTDGGGDLAAGPDGFLYISDFTNDRVLRIVPVCDTATFQQSPAPASVPFGGGAQFSVVATGTGSLSYQWRKGGVNLTDGPVGCGGTISGASTNTLVLNTVTFVEGGSYDCVVTNACGSNTSTAATLTINPPPAAADVNHDGQVNGADIQALVNALLAP